MNTRRPTPTLWSTGILLVTLLSSGCDTVDTPTSDAVLFNHIEHVATGRATLSLTDHQGLTVSPSAPDEGVNILVAGKKRGDFLFKPVPIAPGDVFSLRLNRKDETKPRPLAQVLHQGLDDGRVRLDVDFSAIGARTASVDFYNQGKHVYSEPHLNLVGDGAVGQSEVGVSLQKPTSWHYEVIQDGDETIIKVVVDYENAAGSTTTAAHTVITPLFKETAPIVCTHVAFTVRVPLQASLFIHSVEMAGMGMRGLTLVKEALF